MSSALQILYGRLQGTLYTPPEIITWTPLELFSSGANGGWYDFSDTTKMWQDGSKTIQAENDGDRVSVVEAQNAGGPDLVSFNSDKRPTVRISGGVSYLEFDPTLEQNLEADIAITQGPVWSVFIGANFKTLTSTPQYIVDADPGGPRIAQYIRATNTDLQSISFDNTGTPTTLTYPSVLNTGVWTTPHALRDSSGLTVYSDKTNSVTTSIANTGNTGSTKFFVGARANATGGGGPFFDGYASQVILVADAAISSDDRSKAHDYIQNRAP